jgi:hypothetical protein
MRGFPNSWKGIPDSENDHGEGKCQTGRREGSMLTLTKGYGVACRWWRKMVPVLTPKAPVISGR